MGLYETPSRPLYSIIAIYHTVAGVSIAYLPIGLSSVIFKYSGMSKIEVSISQLSVNLSHL